MTGRANPRGVDISPQWTNRRIRDLEARLTNLESALFDGTDASGVNTVEIDSFQDKWTLYTPEWQATGTAPSLGNGVIAGRYITIGKTCFWRVSVQFGSTSTYGTGFYRFTLPGTSIWKDDDAVGNATVIDASATAIYGFTAALDNSASSVRLYGNANEKVGPTTPITLTTNDRIIVTGAIELA